MSDTHIGFIGLGLMGRAMVGCLQDAGFALSVLGNTDRTGIEAALARGATEAADARALTQAADVVMICVGTSDQVEGRVYGDAGILAGAKDGQIIIDFGTSLPGSSKKIGTDLAAKGAIYLDAPLGRTPAHAKDGNLNIMCSGDKAGYDRVKPLLDVLGENVFHLGALGNGNTIKLINNYYAMTSALAMTEAFALADSAGVDRQAMYEVIAAGPNHSGMMDFIRNYAIEGKVDLAFSVDNATKDIGYYRKMAQDLGLKSRMSGAADATFREIQQGGDGALLVPQVVDWMSTHLEDK